MIEIDYNTLVYFEMYEDPIDLLDYLKRYIKWNFKNAERIQIEGLRFSECVG